MFTLLSILFISSTSEAIDPETNMDVMQIIKYWGYPVEKYDVVTNDGYILDLYRIPHGRNRNTTARSTPLLLVAGLFASSATLVQNPPQSSPAMILADEGFDVFLFNHRGTRYGMRHTRMIPNNRDFWKFTLDHYANCDAPAVVDKVLSITGQDTLYWIGHSQGTIIGFMFLADNPSYNNKIRAIFALTPVGTVHYAKGLSRVIIILYKLFRPLITTFHHFFGSYQIGNQHQWFFRLYAEYLCLSAITGKICDSIWSWANGPSSATFNRSRQLVYFSHYPDGTSSWALAQYGQIATSNEILHYDPNPLSGIWSERAAPYNYSNIVAPMYLFWSRNDWMTPPEEIADVILPRMRKGVVKGTFEVPKYNHIDFVFATDNSARVFTIITDVVASLMVSLAPGIILYSIIGSLSTILNIALLICTFLRTPKTFLSYSLLLKIQAIADMATSLAIIFTMQRMIPFEWTVLYVSYGPCIRLGTTACYGGFAVIVSTTVVSVIDFVNVLICMGARLWILRNGSISRTRIWMTFMLGGGIPAVFIIVVLIISRIDDVAAIELFNQFTHEVTTGVVITGNSGGAREAMIGFVAVIFVFPIPLFLTIWFYRSLVLRVLDEKKDKMSTLTRISHRQFVKSLTLQAVLPVFTIIGVLTVGLEYSNLVRDPYLEMTVYLLNNIPPLLSPIIVMRHIRHYNRLLKSVVEFMFRRGIIPKDSEVESTRRTASSISQNPRF